MAESAQVVREKTGEPVNLLDAAGQPYVAEPKLAVMPGVARVVYENNQVMFNSSWSGPVDSGVELKDGAVYEVIISAMAGTTGNVASISNILFPVILNGDGSFMSHITDPQGEWVTAVGRSVFTFRYQERFVEGNNALKNVYVNPSPFETLIGSGRGTNNGQFDINEIDYMPIIFEASGLAAEFQIIDSSNILRIGAGISSGTPDCNMRMLFKIIERQSSESIN